jgi:hypothetical protein
MECWEKQFVRMLFPYSAERLRIGQAYTLKERHIPRKLYKYRSFNERHLQGLRDGVLWMSAPERFNDPYDSVIYFDSRRFWTEDLSVEGVHAKAESEYLDAPWQWRDLANPIRQDKWQAKLHDVLLRDYPRNQRSRLEAAIEGFGRKANLEMIERMSAFQRRSMSVLSLAETPVSALMWSHYSDSHSGFCIEYDFGALGADDLRRRFCYPVIYRRKLTDATRYLTFTRRENFNNLFGKLLCLLKSDEWAYEKEWRIVEAVGPADANRTIEMPRPTGVIVGCQAKEEDRERLRGICDGLGVELREARQQREAFRLEIVNVDQSSVSRRTV